MPTFTLTLDGGPQLTAALRGYVEHAPSAARAADTALALVFIRAAKQYASGPARIAGKDRRTRGRKGKPARSLSWGDGGPGVVTGFLRGSIQVRADHALTPTVWETTVYPSGPYYRRLELGFTGRDSLGRNYNQPRYPFMGPALLDTRVAFGVAVSAFQGVIDM